MNIKQYALISSLAALIGILIFAYQKEIILLNVGSPLSTQELAKISQKKSFAFFYWLNDAWHTEQIQLICSDAIAANMQQLIQRWLQLMHEEKVIRKKVQLQTGTLNFDQTELLLSFDRLAWNKDHSTYDKWMIIETVLKTIRQAEPRIKRVRFLINQQPLLDTHLDFTNPWPITGFIP